MAIDAQVLTVYDGAVNATVQVIGKSDGQAGQEVNVVKVDVSELNPPCSTVRIEEFSYDVEGGTVTLSWDDVTPVPFAYLKGNDRIIYRREGGLQNAGDPTSRSGDILLSTIDFEGNGSYTILLKMRKKFA
jgi:hypothetical protein